jgi:ATP-dependent DNA helicase RecG
LRLLRVLRDEALIEQAREDAELLIATDNDLSDYPALKAELAQLQRDQAVDYLDKG